MVTRVRGDDTPSDPKSTGGEDKDEDEKGEEGEVTPPLHSTPHEALPLLGDIFGSQAGIVVGSCQPKQPWTETGPLTGSLP
jgi:hypothetical protein